MDKIKVSGHKRELPSVPQEPIPSWATQSPFNRINIPQAISKGFKVTYLNERTRFRNRDEIKFTDPVLGYYGKDHFSLWYTHPGLYIEAIIDGRGKGGELKNYDDIIPIFNWWIEKAKGTSARTTGEQRAYVLKEVESAIRSVDSLDAADANLTYVMAATKGTQYENSEYIKRMTDAYREGSLNEFQSALSAFRNSLK